MVLGVTPLGTAFALVHGWAKGENEPAHPLRLQPSKSVLASLAEEARVRVRVRVRVSSNPNANPNPKPNPKPNQLGASPEA